MLARTCINHFFNSGLLSSPLDGSVAVGMCICLNGEGQSALLWENGTRAVRKAINAGDFTHALRSPCGWNNASVVLGKRWEGRDVPSLRIQSCSAMILWKQEDEKTMKRTASHVTVCRLNARVFVFFVLFLRCIKIKTKIHQLWLESIFHVYIPLSSTQSTPLYSVCVSFLFSGAGEVL